MATDIDALTEQVSSPTASASFMAPGLDGRVAIVTGGGHGLGYFIASALARHGVRILVSGRNQEHLDRARADLEGFGCQVETRVGDVRSSASARELAGTAMARWGRIDVLVNNAGIAGIKPTLEMTDDDWHEVIDTDLTGPFFCSRAVAPAMIAQRNGCIVNISSILGVIALPKRAAYASSKHGLIGLTKVLAVEWGPSNVRVNALLPGMFPVPGKDRSVTGASDQQLVDRTPLKRFGRPEEVGDLVCYLASDAGTFISGAAITIDGGWTAYGGWEPAP